MKRTGGTTDGEIIQVQGGHIIRATGRKDRHSKVYTAKGPRDRRVRLSAHTAIQFYDVQDRLGYDRPSKAVDWLIKKAKDAIDKLSESPQPYEITMDQSTDSNPGSGKTQANLDQQHSEFAFQQHQHQQPQLRHSNSGVVPSTAEAQSIAESMKSFFPMSSGNLLMNMQNYPHDERMSSRGPSIQTEDLGLSLQSTLQGQNLNHQRPNYTDEVLLSENFEANYQKTEAWDGAEEAEGGENRIGFIFNSHSIPQPQLFYAQSSAFSQRELLQSNYSQLVHSWNERQLPSLDQQKTQPIQQSSAYNIHFGSNFQVPARIHGEDEHGVLSIHPSSVSPNSQL